MVDRRLEDYRISCFLLSIGILCLGEESALSLREKGLMLEIRVLKGSRAAERRIGCVGKRIRCSLYRLLVWLVLYKGLKYI